MGENGNLENVRQVGKTIEQELLALVRSMAYSAQQLYFILTKVNANDEQLAARFAPFTRRIHVRYIVVTKTITEGKAFFNCNKISSSNIIFN